MRNIGRWAARHGVFVGMIFLFLALWGVYGLTRLPVDLFPEMELPGLSVIVVYRGASASDVESQVTKPIEDAVSGLSGIKEVNSVSADNIGTVTCVFEFGTSLDQAANDIRDRLGLIRRQLPAEIDEPMIFKFNTSMMPVVFLTVTAESGRVEDYYETVRVQVKERLQHVDGVGSVQIMNPSPQEVHVQVHRERLEQLGMSLAQIGAAIQMQNVTVPAGSLVVGTLDYSVRVPGEFRDLEDLRDLVVGASRTGGIVRLRDLADVSIGMPDQTQDVRANGRPALFVVVQKRSGANTVNVAEAIKVEAESLNTRLPHGLRVHVVTDASQFVRLMIHNLSDSLYTGVVLVVLVVFLFLRRLRSSLVVALTIPASLAIAFAVLYFAGATLNVVTLMGLVLAIGMVVDNGIVVLENIARRLQTDRVREEAVAEGTREVVGAVIGSTTTTIVVFLPLLLVGGVIGIMFKQLAFVMISTIVASLLAAVLLTPMAAARLLRTAAETRPPRGWIGRSIESLHALSERAYAGVENAYGVTVGWAVRHKAVVLAAALLLAGVTVKVAGSAGMSFMPQITASEVMITGTLPVGTATPRTSDVAAQVEAILRQEAGPDLQLAVRLAGPSSMGFDAVMGQKSGTHIFTVIARLRDQAQRVHQSMEEFAARVRRRLDRIPDLLSYQVQTQPIAGMAISGGQKPIVVEVAGDDLDEVEQGAAKVRKLVASIPGTTEVVADAVEMRPEARVQIQRLRASLLGVNSAMAGDAVRSALLGATKGSYRGAGIAGQEADIVVRLNEQDRETLADLDRFTVPSVTGAQVSLANLGEIVEGRSPIEIRRKDRQRVLAVTAYTTGRALADIARDIERGLPKLGLPEAVNVRFGGDIKQQRETMGDLALAFAFAVLLVYIVLACQYGTLRDPLVVMFSVPFALTGIFLALPVLGIVPSALTILGMIMLAGIVVNNGVVLVDYVNLLRREQGMTVVDAVVATGRRRLRPILMTAFAAVLGMLPMALATGEGHELWQELGIAVIAGLLVSTFVTLFVVPTAYVLLHWPEVRRERRAAAAAQAAAEGGAG